MIHPRWTSHIKDSERKKSFIDAVNGSTVTLNRLRGIVEEEIQLILKTERTETYDSNNWSHKQAHRNGAYRILYLLKDLLDVTRDRTLNPIKDTTNVTLSRAGPKPTA